MDVSDKTLKKIEENKIAPRARWRFLLKDYFVWLFFCMSVIVGALATSAIIFMLTSNDWDIYKYLDKGLFQYIFSSMPYFWILVLLVFILVAYGNFRYTRRGYRYEIHLIILGSIMASLALGLVIFLGGIGESIHNIFMKQVPFYNNLVSARQEAWNNPQNGLLGGQIIKVTNQNEFVLQDFNGKIWRIEKENTECCKSSFIHVGGQIEMIGRLGPNGIFFVKELRFLHCCHK